MAAKVNYNFGAPSTSPANAPPEHVQALRAFDVTLTAITGGTSIPVKKGAGWLASKTVSWAGPKLANGAKAAWCVAFFDEAILSVKKLALTKSVLGNNAHRVMPYGKAAKETKGAAGELQAHHLVEQWFKRVMGGNTREWPSVVLTRKEHQEFTNAWRKAIPYGSRPDTLNTRTATRADVRKAARRIYAEHPKLQKAAMDQ